ATPLTGRIACAATEQPRHETKMARVPLSTKKWCGQAVAQASGSVEISLALRRFSIKNSCDWRRGASDGHIRRGTRGGACGIGQATGAPGSKSARKFTGGRAGIFGRRDSQRDD